VSPRGFEGRTALVTGGAGDIGGAVVARLQAGGARVATLDLRPSTSAGVLSLTGDVRQSADVDRAIGDVETQLGPLDILVCAAGVTGDSLPTVEVPDDEWRRVMQINCDGVFWANRAAAKVMVPRGYGRIVNVASIAGKEGNPTASAYSASKAAVIGLTKSLGKELAKTGVTVNCITPATVETPILAQVSQAHIDYMRSKIPMERFGTVDEMAAIITWLASEECSFTTGAVFDVSGGRATY
jgi:2-dehydro-3-deoxy-L-rhamnonate dehydrogenase (NAD+)